MNETLLVIIIAALSFLTLATVAIHGLLFKSPRHETFLKVKVIVHSWWLIVGYILVCLALAPLGLLIGFGLIGVLGVREYLKHSALSSIKSWVWFIQIPLLVFQSYFLFQFRWDFFFLIPLIAIFISFPLVTIKSAMISQLPLIFSSFVGLTLLVHFLFYVPALFIFINVKNGTDVAFIFVAVLLTLTILNDVLQFISGKAFGKYKIVPQISPNKTLEGFIGGWLGTSLLAMTLLTLSSQTQPLTGFLVGTMIAFFGMVGDLTFSAIKRYFATKDFSAALPGHGGILDRCDSLIFTAPATFFLIYFIGGL